MIVIMMVMLMIMVLTLILAMMLIVVTAKLIAMYLTCGDVGCRNVDSGPNDGSDDDVNGDSKCSDDIDGRINNGNYKF